MADRRATILGLASVLLLFGRPSRAWAGPQQEVRIAVKGMVCPA